MINKNNPRKHLILDAFGVLFYEEDDFKECFLDYLITNSGIIEKEAGKKTIKTEYLKLTRGMISSDNFFENIKIQNPDLSFLLDVNIDKQFYGFLNTFPNRISVLSNDSQEWANYRNNTLGFNFPYFTSSLFGERKPSIRAYEKVCWALDTVPENCIYVDNLVLNLSSPSSIGMEVVLFRRDGINSSSHPLVKSFIELRQIVGGK